MTDENVADAASPEPRLAALKKHPLINDKAVIVTQLVEDVYDEVESGLTFRYTGLSYEMPPRFGKTWCIRGVKHLLGHFEPSVLTFVLTARGDDKAVRTQRAFNGDLLMALGHGAAARVNAADRLAAALNFVRTARDIKAVEIGAECEQIIFFIDEGQNWTIKDWGFWKDFTNLFVHDDPIHILTVVFSQPEVFGLIKTLRAKPDIFYRFFLQHRPLQGIRHKSELWLIMKRFDSGAAMEHPEGSGRSYTEFFMPQAYTAGWRLANELDHAWAAIKPVKGEKNRTELAMASVSQVLKIFLISQMQADGPQYMGGDPEQWLNAAKVDIFRDLQSSL